MKLLASKPKNVMKSGETEEINGLPCFSNVYTKDEFIRPSFEFLNLLSHCQVLFDSADFNGDGKLSGDEFFAFSHPEGMLTF